MSRVRSQTGDRGLGVRPEVGAAVAARSSVVTMTRWTPSRRSSCTTLGHVHLALRVLAAGHRHGAVVEQLERDVDAGGDGRAHGERAGVEVGAVAEVLDDVLAVDERRHADPLGALVAHRGEPGDVADPLGLHQGDHRVAPDASADERARGHPVETLCGQPLQ